MAPSAHTTSAPAREPATFTINGVIPFRTETVGEYVRGAHAVALVTAGQTREDEEFYSTDALVSGALEAIALLLSHAELLLERGATE